MNRVLKEFESYLLKTGGLDKHSFYSLFIVSRELLENALVHGNNNKEAATILFRVDKVDPLRFRITVHDDGEGFDYKAINTEPPENPRWLRQKGYILVNSLAEHIWFNRKGNMVSAYIRLGNDKKVSNAQIENSI